MNSINGLNNQIHTLNHTLESATKSGIRNLDSNTPAKQELEAKVNKLATEVMEFVKNSNLDPKQLAELKVNLAQLSFHLLSLDVQSPVLDQLHTATRELSKTLVAKTAHKTNQTAQVLKEQESAKTDEAITKRNSITIGSNKRSVSFIPSFSLEEQVAADDLDSLIPEPKSAPSETPAPSEPSSPAPTQTATVSSSSTSSVASEPQALKPNTPNYVTRSLTQAFNSHITPIKNKIDALQAKQAALQDRSNELETELNAKRSALEEKTSSLKTNNHLPRTERNTLIKQRAVLKKEIDDVKKRMKSNNSKIKDNEKDLNKMQQRLARVRTSKGMRNLRSDISASLETITAPEGRSSIVVSLSQTNILNTINEMKNNENNYNIRLKNMRAVLIDLKRENLLNKEDKILLQNLEKAIKASDLVLEKLRSSLKESRVNNQLRGYNFNIKLFNEAFAGSHLSALYNGLISADEISILSKNLETRIDSKRRENPNSRLVQAYDQSARQNHVILQGLASHGAEPFQRIGRYKMELEAISKQLEPAAAKALAPALDNVKQTVQLINDY